ncbi:hypothetical protein LSTR_LSTR010872 [Laodelphax striatellus]|uniref:Uncharacterized protein n=1 Tax=Laodelphax striatellus TaxID=195883 RepID=A0A482XD15_LAOST|nr:hypothetical protein LSTR_LSTR010872 [Laodelphax striatellus]
MFLRYSLVHQVKQRPVWRRGPDGRFVNGGRYAPKEIRVLLHEKPDGRKRHHLMARVPKDSRDVLGLGFVDLQSGNGLEIGFPFRWKPLLEIVAWATHGFDIAQCWLYQIMMDELELGVGEPRDVFRQQGA